MSTGYSLDWDSTIDKDERQPFEAIPEGDYDFTVDHFERDAVKNAESKYLGEKMAVVYLNIAVPGEEDVQLKENFILHSNFAWKIGSLLVSTGLKKRGEPITGGYWNKLPGCRGRCHVIQTKGKKEGSVFNNVETFYAPDDSNDSGANKWAL